jgi:hypothetical protein
MTRSMTRRSPNGPARTSARRLVLPAAVGALTLVLAACGGDGPGASEVDDKAAYGTGPLDAYFERIYGGMDEGAWEDQQREVEQLMAECMADQGFEYVPVDYSSMSQPAYEEPDVEWGTREFAEQYGYGMSTWPGMDEQPLPEEEVGFQDPNQAYVEAMSDTERDAYYVALYGDQTGPEPGEEDEWEWDWTTAGCQGSSQHAIEEKYGLGGEEMTALQEEMEAMWGQIQADERLTSLNARWADCMADAGYTGLASMDDAQNSLMEEQNAIYEEVYGNGEVDDADWQALEAEVKERTAALTEREIATAVADFDCRDSIDFEKTQVEVANEHQQRFVDTHRAELEAWVESAETARS